MGRKRKASEAQNREPSTSGAELELRWEWETSGNTWQQFTPEENETLSQASRAGKPSADIGDSCVDLCRMVRRDKQTGEETRVAAAVQDQDSYFVWQWQGDQEGSWFAYPADTCLALQAARNGHREPTVEVTVGRTHYKLDTTRMMQTNTRTASCEDTDTEGKSPCGSRMHCQTGEVGKPGQHSLVSCAGDLGKAKDIFTKKFLDKTKNEWAKRCNFQKVPGKYDLLRLDYEANDAGEEEAAPQKTSSCPKPVSLLEPRVQALVQLICNIRTMEEMVMEMKYDTKKAPLGKLTAEQIRAGLKTPPLIRTENELKEKLQLLEALSEIRIGIKAVRSERLDQEHPLDQNYRGLNCELQPLERDKRYLSSTHAPTHKDYTMTLMEVFVLKKESAGSDSAFRSELPNRANYCFATREKDIGLLLLSEVALGECNELLEANPEAERLLAGKHSTKGLGKLAPSLDNSATLYGAVVPLGPPIETGVLNPHGYTLNYNEFIVYDPRQVRMKYLLKVRFNFTQLW
ncbi:hypothetical protein JD844_001196 [Phrynosoma platyrhinos]|uniref:Poly [ADP-ribose] polymerase n=1 Tax=Phrynosoma platyrhinos TaxID=52577 RepID=A0ABQ7TA24_PHRPL|nr:hypothetical protein JD844_001196 [Phrynosoma platyrhinos]